MDASFRDWAWLPPLFVDMMVGKLDRLSEYVRFSSVCPQWRYVAVEANLDHKVNLDIWKSSRGKLPMLLFKTDENNDECRSLYSISDEKTYHVKLPLPYKSRFSGSSFGWLFGVEKDTMVITLMNPYKSCCIPLPVIHEEPSKIRWSTHGNYLDYYVSKGILSSDPHVSDSFEVVVLYGGSGAVAFFRPGMPSWSLFTDGNNLTDIIYYKGKLYGINTSLYFFEIDLHNRIMEVVTSGHSIAFSQVYLVESQDAELLMITRRWAPDFPYDNNYDDAFSNTDDDDDDQSWVPDTHEFKVFKMTHPIEFGSATWVEINSIGQQALFLGENHSVCVSTTEFLGCQPNSIYYTSQYHVDCPPENFNLDDSGFFNLEDGRFYKHHVLDSSYNYVQPSIWFLATPQL